VSGRQPVDQARGLLDIGRGQDATDLLTAFLAEHPADAPALSLLAWAHLQCERPEAALRAADDALTADPDYQPAWQRRSWALRALGRTAEAVTAAREYVRLAPHSWVSHYTLGMVLRSEPGNPEVLAAAQRAVRLAPDLADPHVLLGLAHADDNATAQAEACYHRALAINPDHAHARSNLSALALRRGRFDEAIRGFRSAARSRPQEVMFHRNIGVAVFNSLLKYGYLLALASAIFAGVVGTLFSPPDESPDWLGRLGALLVILLAWATLLTVRLRPLSAYLRRQVGSVFGSLLRTVRFLPLFAGFVLSQVCVLVLLLASTLPDASRGNLVLAAGSALAMGSLISRSLGRRGGQRT
jgi:tetratricopeptide (TPR) repeat protein